MSGHHDPASDPVTGSDCSTSPLYNNQSRVIGVVRIRRQPSPDAREQSEITQHVGQRPLTYLQHLEMEFTMRYRSIINYWRQQVWSPAGTEVNLNLDLVPIDPTAQEIVYKGFVAQAYQNQKELHDLKQALNEKMEECDKIREHWQTAIGELSDLKSSEQVFMVDDAEMVSKWNQLQYAIKNFARTYLYNPISPKCLTQKQGALLESVSPLCKEFLSTEGQVHLLFQSLVWMYITERILMNPTKIWGKTFSGAFDTLLKIRHNSKEDYHSWRAQTGGIIQNARGTSNTMARDLKREMYSIIAQFIPKNALADKRHGDIIHRSVERIVDKAIEIAVIFNQSRCLYRLRRVVHRERFSPTAMEYGEECDAPQVDLMISPGLLKFGNSKGEDYDQRLVLVKSHVCTLKRDTEEEEDGDTDESDGEGSKEGKDDKESDSLIEL